ncbi:LLM class flavin-dependent oxidoreductase [Thermoleophilia bacterium SCSIO 60948]|nr:LLM class flavin-dependent oxidoreductase [Thermoleophilia bacterium SCSIO 60948]
MRIDLMVEGQEDVGWDDWLGVARACERAGIGTLFRSDHYFSVDEIAARGSLDAWGTICGLAAATEKLGLGTLVSPATFRHPSVLAKLAVTAQAIGGPGRIEVGLGTGWWKAEHSAYGFPFPKKGERMSQLTEYVELVSRSWTDEGFSFDGEFFEVEDLTAWPLPQPKPALILGGQGGPRSAALAARWADEYNTPHKTLEQCREIRTSISDACEKAGREPMPLSVMLGFVVAPDRGTLLEKAAEHARWRQSELADDPEAYLADLPEHYVTGTVDEVAAQLRELEEAGVSRAMFQHHCFWDHETTELIGRELAPLVG